jgi:hypothetical protein
MKGAVCEKRDNCAEPGKSGCASYVQSVARCIDGKYRLRPAQTKDQLLERAVSTSN